MKKAILEFEDIDELMTALNGWRYKAAIDELYSAIRQKEKYTGEEPPREWHELREFISEALESYLPE